MYSKLTAGDVRLMRARCQAQIEMLQAAEKGTDAEDFRRAIEIDVMIYQTTLAALNSKPVANVEVDARGCAANFYQLMSGGELLYPVPPALAVPDEPEEADCPEWIVDRFSWKCGAGFMRDTLLNKR